MYTYDLPSIKQNIDCLVNYKSYFLSVCGHISGRAHGDSYYPQPIPYPTTTTPPLQHPLPPSPLPLPTRLYPSHTPTHPHPKHLPPKGWWYQGVHHPSLISTFAYTMPQLLVMYKQSLSIVMCMFCQWAKDPWSYFCSYYFVEVCIIRHAWFLVNIWGTIMCIINVNTFIYNDTSIGVTGKTVAKSPPNDSQTHLFKGSYKFFAPSAYLSASFRHEKMLPHLQ